MKKLLMITAAAAMLFTACKNKKTMTDLIIRNATIYTADSVFSTAGAMAVKDGKILAIGSDRDILRAYHAKRIIDLKGKFVYPGLIDAHCHFYGYGLTLSEADLSGSLSPEEVVERLKKHAGPDDQDWITGRGWDQNLWPGKEYPGLELLDSIFPDRPVFLRRIDGHAAWVNSEALRRAGVTPSTKVEGGTFMKKNGRLTGILIDNAVDFIGDRVPPPSQRQTEEALTQAERNCFAVGLTMVGDAGLPYGIVTLMDSLQISGRLKIRIAAMLTPNDDNMAGFVLKGPYHTDRLTVRTIKLYADGALGSRGAKMKQPYSDDPGNSGLWLTEAGRMEKICRIARQNGYQVATHCIGDEANKAVLDLYASILEGPNDLRWRIEHAQIVDPQDMDLFGKYNIIPSVQTTHATSDMGWAEERIGPERMKGAYAYHDLLMQNGWLPNGSDFPVEDINPLYGFYAAVARKDRAGNPGAGFLPENALSREEALRAMTIWAAMASFDEDSRGSLEAGKWADFIVTGEDLMTAPESELPGIRVLQTWVQGEQVYGE
ncbi:MAG: amidohydrolase [Bacteroidota bacterium]